MGYVGLLPASGELDGVVSRGEDRHVVPGNVRNTMSTTSQTDDLCSETFRETEQFDAWIKTLSRDGKIHVLSDN